jgi:uncharacterized protein YqjF (DUF2071 family)
MNFLTARWTNLFLATFAVPEELLQPRLLPGLELDRREGQCFASLVAFDFLDTRVFGIPWPGYRNFPEINLRFYVRQGTQRGVMFIRELVPKRLVSWIARTLYHEPYRTVPMTSQVTETEQTIAVEHRIEVDGRTHRLRAVGTKPGRVPPPDSVEHFFKEHEWGFGIVRGRLMRYHVQHPVWSIYPVQDWAVEVDWAKLYGPEWAIMQGRDPMSTMLAAGSAVTVGFGEWVV